MSTHFGSFIVPKTHAMHPSVELHPSMRDDIVLPRQIVPPSDGAPFELIVTSTKRLKWQPALQYWVSLLESRIDGFHADDIETIIASNGHDPDETMLVEGEYVTLRTFKVASGVPEQPIGPDEGARGAMQRASDERVLTSLQSVADSGRWGAVVSFESYFCFERQDLSGKPAIWHARHGFAPGEHEGEALTRAYFDTRGRIAVDRAVAYVALTTPGGWQRVVTVSDGVAAPMAYVRAALDLKRSVTVGRLMAGDVQVEGLPPLKVSHDSWHGEFIPGLDRDMILLRTLQKIPFRVAADT